MQVLPKISIITPNYNGDKFLEKTILSVLLQNYPNLEYIIIDGGSTDQSIEIIKKYESQITFWVSEKDNGIYDALQKGFAKSTGEIMGWINSDDMFHPKSFFTLAEIFNNHPTIEWVHGIATVFDDKDRTVYMRSALSNPYSLYIKDYKKDGIFIQQESTLWRRSLWIKAGSNISQQYSLAADFELWIRFFRYAKLYTTSALIGGFRIREGQLSRTHYEKYISESDSIIDVEFDKLSIKIVRELKYIIFHEKVIKKLPIIWRIFEPIRKRLLKGNSDNTIEFDFNNNCF